MPINAKLLRVQTNCLLDVNNYVSIVNKMQIKAICRCTKIEFGPRNHFELLFKAEDQIPTNCGRLTWLASEPMDKLKAT